jgi:hypothetical protein
VDSVYIVGAALVTGLIAIPVSFWLGGRRERSDRRRAFELVVFDQTHEYLLSLSHTAQTVLHLSRSEEPFEARAEAFRRPWRNPAYLPQSAELVELLELCGRVNEMDAAQLRALTSEERAELRAKLGYLRTILIVRHTQRRLELLK